MVRSRMKATKRTINMAEEAAFVYYRSGKKWKERLAVLRSDSSAPVSNQLKLYLYKSNNISHRQQNDDILEVKQNQKLKLKIVLDRKDYCGCLRNLEFDGRNIILAIAMVKSVLLLSFLQWSDMSRWIRMLQGTFGKGVDFSFSEAQPTGVEKKEATMMSLLIHDDVLAVVYATPPRLLHVWYSDQIVSYGCSPKGFQIVIKSKSLFCKRSKTYFFNTQSKSEIKDVIEKLIRRPPITVRDHFTNNNNAGRRHVGEQDADSHPYVNNSAGLRDANKPTVEREKHEESIQCENSQSSTGEEEPVADPSPQPKTSDVPHSSSSSQSLQSSPVPSQQATAAMASYEFTYESRLESILENCGEDNSSSEINTSVKNADSEYSKYTEFNPPQPEGIMERRMKRRQSPRSAKLQINIPPMASDSNYPPVIPDTDTKTSPTIVTTVDTYTLQESGSLGTPTECGSIGTPTTLAEYNIEATDTVDDTYCDVRYNWSSSKKEPVPQSAPPYVNRSPQTKGYFTWDVLKNRSLRVHANAVTKLNYIDVECGAGSSSSAGSSGARPKQTRPPLRKQDPDTMTQYTEINMFKSQAAWNAVRQHRSNSVGYQ